MPTMLKEIGRRESLHIFTYFELEMCLVCLNNLEEVGHLNNVPESEVSI